MPVPEKRRPRVLVADDEQVIADTLCVILNHNGFEAVAAYDGESAVERARSWPPDILLSDVVMPGIDGIATATEICRMIPSCCVLLLSGNLRSPKLHYEAHLCGIDFELLQKPLPPDVLLERLRAVWAARAGGAV